MLRERYQRALMIDYARFAALGSYAASSAIQPRTDY